MRTTAANPNQLIKLLCSEYLCVALALFTCILFNKWKQIPCDEVLNSVHVVGSERLYGIGEKHKRHILYPGGRNRNQAGQKVVMAVWKKLPQLFNGHGKHER